MGIKFEHQDFGIRINRSNVTGDYVYHNFSVWTAYPVYYKGNEITLEFQNGHGFDFGDFNCPTNKLSIYLDGCDLGDELRELYYNDDEDFLSFLDDVENEASMYLDDFFVTDEQEEKIINHFDEKQKEDDFYMSQGEYFGDRTLSQVMDLID